MKFLLDKKIGFVFLLFVVISFLYPTYFISDDWEHLDSIYQEGAAVYLRLWLFRIPALYFVHLNAFPLFEKEYFFLANLIFWLFFLGGMLYALEGLKFLDKLKKESTLFFCFFMVMICFNHNNFEFIFWPSVMVNFPGFFLVSLGFYLTKKYDSWGIQFIKAILWMIGFYFTESLFFMGALLEVAYVLWHQANCSLKKQFMGLFRQLILPAILVLISKLTLTSIESYGYAMGIGFKPHLLYQSLSMVFLHDYYKTRWLTGGLAALSYLLIFVYLFKNKKAKAFLRTEVLFGLIILISLFYYYTIMTYSARRAMGGQLFITWGALCLGYFYVWKSDKDKLLRKIILVLFPLCWFTHSVYVIDQKLGDRSAFRKNAAVIRAKLENGPWPIQVNRSDIMKGVNTGWNLVNKKQKSGWVRHFFKESELKKLKY